MTNRTVIIILSVCTVLFLYIVLVDRDRMSTDEQAAREGHVFAGLRVDFTDQLVVTHKGNKVVLERSLDSAGGPGPWRIVAPAAFAADQVEVRALLSAMDFLMVDRPADGAVDGAAFGLDSPRIQGSVRTGGEVVSFRIGKKASDGGVYVSVTGKDEGVYVVSADFRDAFNKRLSDLRDRTLLDIPVDDVVELRVEGEGGVEFLRDDRRGWQVMVNGLPVPADKGAVRHFISGLVNLKADSFVADGANSLAKWKLDKPAAKVTMARSSGGSAVLRMGGPCEGGVHATVENSGTVVCVPVSFAEQLAHEPERYVQRKLALFDARTVARLHIEKDDAGFALVADADGLWASETMKAADADQVGIVGLVETLGSLVATKIYEGALEEGAVPVARLSFELTDKSTHEWLFYRVTTEEGVGSTVVRRKDEPLLFVVPGNALEGVESSEVFYRRKVISHGNVKDVETLVVEGPVDQELQHADDTWRIVKPVVAPASRRNAVNLAELVVDTKVERYVPRDGALLFGRRFATVTARMPSAVAREDGTLDQTASTEVVLELGAETEGGRYARFAGEDLVFVVGQDSLRPLEAPLGDMGALQVVSADINRLVMKRPGGTVEATLVDGEWESNACDMDSIALKRLVIDLGAMRAIRSHAFGNRTGTPVLTLELFSDKSDAPATLVFGDTVEEVQGILATRGDLDITYVLPARPVGELLALCR